MLADTPIQTGYLEAVAGLSTHDGAFARLEAGVHPWRRLGLFGFGQADTRSGMSAGVGGRYTFGW